MVQVHFTSALNRFFPGLETMEITAASVSEAIEKIEERHPGMKSFLIEDSGELRKHVNLFIGEDEATLSSGIKANEELFIFQALSGG